MQRSMLSLLLVCLATLASSGCSSSIFPQASISPTETTKQLVTLVSQMQEAVLAGDKEIYLGYVDLSDPVFAIEHQRWATGWVKQPPSSFGLQVDQVSIAGDIAYGELTMQWGMEVDSPELTASFPVQFHLGDDGKWRYAGEAWITRDTEHFRIHAWPNTKDTVSKLIQSLPEIYDHVTTRLDYQPRPIMEIKLYDSETALIANTLLDLPRARGWNEPGESLKLVADPKDPLLSYGIAHEFTHFIEFEWAGKAHSNSPWWLSEGLAVYIGSEFEPRERVDSRLDRVRASVTTNGLLDWNAISDFETAPVQLWPQVYAQGYAFVRYITETYGAEQRNEWLQAMATEMDLEQASEVIFGISFNQLDAQFRTWLQSL
jgi:hypothetical protein